MTYAQLSVNAREIVAKFTLATSQEVQLGCDWYASAFQISCRIANKYGLRPEVAAGVIAALSPNNRWERNIIDAEAIIKCWAAGGTDEDILAGSWAGLWKGRGVFLNPVIVCQNV